jgi:hypothetical protein
MNVTFKPWKQGLFSMILFHRCNLTALRIKCSPEMCGMDGLMCFCDSWLRKVTFSSQACEKPD